MAQKVQYNNVFYIMCIAYIPVTNNRIDTLPFHKVMFGEEANFKMHFF